MARRILLVGMLLAVVWAPPALAQRAIYTISGSSQLLAHSIDEQGALAPLAGSPHNVGGVAELVVVPADGRFAFVTSSSSQEIASFEIAADGSLTELSGSPTPTGSEPSAIATSPAGERLYVGLASDEIASYEIAADGSLTELPGSPTTISQAPVFLAASPDGRHLYATSAPLPELHAFRVEQDGSLTVLPGSPHTAGPGGLSITPDGTRLYAASPPDELDGFQVAADGSLTLAPGFPLDTSTGPALTAITPDGAHLYVTSLGLGMIDGYAIGAQGELTSVPSSPYAFINTPFGAWAAPDGRHLFVSLRELNGSIHSIPIVGPGFLDALQQQVFPTGTSFPEALLVRPNQGPVAEVSAAVVGLEASFDASGSSDPDGAVARYDWDFGDGTTLADGGPTVTHTYSVDGTKSATVTVTDNEGCSSELVFTGQTAHCNGGAGASASTTIDVVAPVASASSLPSRLSVRTARLANRRLVVAGRLARGAAGERLALRLRARGRALRLSPRVRPNGSFKVSRRLSGPQRRASWGRLSVRFAGNDRLRARQLALRAARRPVRLRLDADRIRVGQRRARIAGRVARAARGRVQVRIELNRADGTPIAVSGSLPVDRRGRFQGRLRVPAAVRSRGAALTVVHRGRGRLHGQAVTRSIGG